MEESKQPSLHELSFGLPRPQPEEITLEALFEALMQIREDVAQVKQ